MKGVYIMQDYFEQVTEELREIRQNKIQLDNNLNVLENHFCVFLRHTLKKFKNEYNTDVRFHILFDIRTPSTCNKYDSIDLLGIGQAVLDNRTGEVVDLVFNNSEKKKAFDNINKSDWLELLESHRIYKTLFNLNEIIQEANSCYNRLL